MRIRTHSSRSRLYPNAGPSWQLHPFVKSPRPIERSLPHGGSTLRSPTVLSPRHPESFRYDRGLHKFSTGLVPLHRSLRHSTGADQTAFKIYSERSLSRTAYQRLRTLPDTTLLSTGPTLESFLRRIQNTVFKAFLLEKGIREVFIQIFKDQTDLSPIKSLQSFISPRERQWNFYCQVYRPALGHDASKSFISLQIPFIRVPSIPRVEGVRLTGWSLALRLRGRLKSEVFQSDTDASASRDRSTSRISNRAIQSIVDRTIQVVIRSMLVEPYVDPTKLISSVMEKFRAYVKVSPFKELIDFNELEVTASRPGSGPRFISNRLLDADGSEYIPPLPLETSDAARLARIGARPLTGQSIETVDPFRVMRESDPNIANLKFAMNCTHHVSTTHFILSDLTKAKTGVNSLQVRLKSGNSIANGETFAFDLFRELDNVCQTINASGLLCFAKASALLNRKYMDVVAEFVSSALRLDLEFPTSSTKSDPPEQTLKGMMTVNINTEGRADISVVLPKLDDIKLCLAHQPPKVVRLPNLRLDGNYCEASNLTSGSLDHPSLSAHEEVSILTKMTYAVITRLCEEMTFTSYQDAATTIAETIVCTIQFPNPAIRLQGSRVAIDPAEEASLSRISAVASPAKSVKPPTFKHRKAAADIVGKESSHDDYHEQLLRDGRLKVVSKDSTDGNPRQAIVVSRGHVSKSKLPVLAAADLVVLRVEPVVSSASFRKSTGFDRYGFNLSWSSEHLKSVSDFTSSRMQTIIERALETSPGRGLCRIRKAVDRLAEQLPNEPHFKLILVQQVNVNLATDVQTKAKGGFVHLVLNGQAQSLATHPRKIVSITIPLITGMPVQLEQPPDPTTTCSLTFRLEGVIPEKDSAHETNTIAPIPQILNIMRDIAFPQLNRTVYTDLKALSEDMVSVLMNNRQDFQTVVEVQDVIVTSYLHKNGQHIAKVSAQSRSIAYDAEHHSSKQPTTRPIVLGSDAPKAALAEEYTDEPTVTDTEQSIRDLMPPPMDVDSPQIEFKKAESPDLASQWCTGERSESMMPTTPNAESLDNTHLRKDKVFIALGSNVGNRLQNIEEACREMDAVPNIHVARTSALYETDPMYFTDQARFLNGVCEIETDLRPMELLEKLQDIEQRLGRVKLVEKGPRNIDLDILIYRKERITTDKLVIPHPLMHEREFVLRPLCDISTAKHFRPKDGHQYTFLGMLKRLPPSPSPIYPITCLGRKDLRTNDPSRKTWVMAIMNMTPDSFSDGGNYDATDLERMKQAVSSQVAAGASIIDIGGQSSRPHAPNISAEEEIARVLPAVKAVKSLPEAEKVAISVDTYRAAVAKAAVEAGAHIVNDISAGQLDPEMLPTIAKLGCTYVMMHMRGNPETMSSKEHCTYPHGVIEGIKVELFQRLKAAEDAGIRRWRIILDPGIGFSKTQDQNLEILRRLHELRKAFHSLPWLVGSSRKGFIGKITGVPEPRERIWGTAATVTAAVQGGADIVRVHDVAEMAAVVKMADAMYRV